MMVKIVIVMIIAAIIRSLIKMMIMVSMLTSIKKKNSLRDYLFTTKLSIITSEINF